MLWQNYQQNQLHHISFSHKYKIFSGFLWLVQLGLQP
jgi:hypothetical protein